MMTQLEPDRFEEGEEMLLSGIRRYHAFTAAAEGIEDQWRDFTTRYPQGSDDRTLYGVICGHDQSGFEYMTAARVKSFAELPEGAGRMRVPAERYAVFRHRGTPENIRESWDSAFAWLEAGPYVSAETPDFECYSGGGARQDRNVEVWVGVRVP